MFGYMEAEAVGQSIRMLIPRELQEEEDTVLAKIRAGEIVDHYETIRRRKDGTLLSISLTVSPIRDDTGEVVGASKSPETSRSGHAFSRLRGSMRLRQRDLVKSVRWSPPRSSATPSSRRSPTSRPN